MEVNCSRIASFAPLDPHTTARYYSREFMVPYKILAFVSNFDHFRKFITPFP
jgi:hypothetical protein